MNTKLLIKHLKKIQRETSDSDTADALQEIIAELRLVRETVTQTPQNFTHITDHFTRIEDHYSGNVLLCCECGQPVANHSADLHYATMRGRVAPLG